MRFLFCLFVSFIFSTPSMSQSSWESNRYSGITDNDKTIVFFDDFTNQKGNWKKSDHFSTSLNNFEGKLFIETNKNTDFVLWQDIYLRDGIDFEIEARLKILESKHTLFHTLFWQAGKSDFANFGITSNRHFGGKMHRLNQIIDLITPYPCGQILEKQFNKITIRKVGREIFFFINEILVASRPYVELKGNRFGFQLGEKSLIELDYFLVQELKEDFKALDFFNDNMDGEELEEPTKPIMHKE